MSLTQVPGDISFVDCTSLRDAAERGHSGCLTALVHTTAAVASTAGELDSERRTVLHVVKHAACDCAAVTAALIAALIAEQQLTSTINLTDSSGYTALEYAVYTPTTYGTRVCHSCLQLLLAAGATAERSALDSVLQDSCSIEQQKLSVQALVRSGVQLDGALHEHAGHWLYPDAVEVLLACGADAMAVDAHGDTPLHYAVCLDISGTCSHEEDELNIGDCPTTCSAIQALYNSAGAACLTAASDIGGDTPLHGAVLWPKHVELLLKLGADANAVNHAGETPLHCAAATGHLLSLKLLLEAGAKTEAADYNGATPLLLAAWHCRSAHLQMLLEAGANTAARTDDEQSIAVQVLHNLEACYYDTAAPSLLDPRLECVLALERAGLDWPVRCLSGEALLYQAARGGSVAVVQHLLHAVLPTVPEAVNTKCAVSGATALHAAAEICNVQLVQLLLRSGAARSLRVRDNDGYTPLRSCVTNRFSAAEAADSSSSAFRAEQAAMMQLLLDAGAGATELDKWGYVPLAIHTCLLC
jgi:ankyrin repeat protein